MATALSAWEVWFELFMLFSVILRHSLLVVLLSNYVMYPEFQWGKYAHNDKRHSELLRSLRLF